MKNTFTYIFSLCLLCIFQKTLATKNEKIKASISNAINKLGTYSSNSLALTSNGENEHTISISGSATKTVEPNLIKLGIKVQTLDKVLKKSYMDNSIYSNRVTDIFKNMGIPKKNITTTNYEITPEYENIYIPANNSYVNVFKGYKVKNEMEVTLSKKDIAQNLMDKVVLSGPVEVTHVTFDFSDGFIKSVKDSLLEEAALDAYERAKSIAEVLRVSIDDVKSINIDEWIFPIFNQLAFNYSQQYLPAGVTAGTITTTLPPPKFYSGTNDISMNIRVVFIITKE